MYLLGLPRKPKNRKHPLDTPGPPKKNPIFNGRWGVFLFWLAGGLWSDPRRLVFSLAHRTGDRLIPEARPFELIVGFYMEP